MTKTEFTELISRGTLLLDGATGTNLIAAGMPRGVCPEAWILEHGDLLVDLQKQYVAAGSRVLYAPTFSANRLSLSHYSLEGKIEELIHGLVGLSRKAADRDTLIAGDLTTTGEVMEPAGEMTHDRLLDYYTEQIRIMADAGVDLIVAETMLGLEEAGIALEAAASVCDLPVMCTFSFMSNGFTMYGGSAEEAAKAIAAGGASAVGANCAAGPDQMINIVASMARNTDIPIITRPNAGMPMLDDNGDLCYPMQPEEFCRHIGKLIEAGASIIGGCCGTTPAHIRLLHDAYCQ